MIVGHDRRQGRVVRVVKPTSEWWSVPGARGRLQAAQRAVSCPSACRLSLGNARALSIIDKAVMGKRR